MIIYDCIRENAALSTTVDFIQIISGATRSCLVLELDFEGDGTASAYDEVGVYRVTTQGTGTAPTATTPATRDSPNMTGTTPALAFSGLFYGGTGYGTTQPTLATQPMHNIPVNANGQRYFWRANPNLNNAIVIPGAVTAGAAAGSLSFRSQSGTGNTSGRVQIAEL
jgi:hypothetical protein